MTKFQNMTKRLFAVGLLLTTLGLGGCADIVFKWYVPDPSDCSASATEYVNASTGTAVKDHDGGTGIVDRHDQLVQEYCFRKCAANEIAVGDTYIDLHNNGKYVVAQRNCKSTT